MHIVHYRDTTALSTLDTVINGLEDDRVEEHARYAEYRQWQTQNPGLVYLDDEGEEMVFADDESIEQSYSYLDGMLKDLRAEWAQCDSSEAYRGALLRMIQEVSAATRMAGRDPHSYELLKDAIAEMREIYEQDSDAPGNLFQRAQDYTDFIDEAEPYWTEMMVNEQRARGIPEAEPIRDFYEWALYEDTCKRGLDPSQEQNISPELHVALQVRAETLLEQTFGRYAGMLPKPLQPEMAAFVARAAYEASLQRQFTASPEVKQLASDAAAGESVNELTARRQKMRQASKMAHMEERLRNLTYHHPEMALSPEGLLNAWEAMNTVSQLAERSL